MQLAVIVETALSVLAAATAIQAAATVTLLAPTTTLSAASTSPTSVAAALCRTNLECCEVVEPPPTTTLPIIGLPQPPKLAGPLIGFQCSPIDLLQTGNTCAFTSVCCDTVFTEGILADGCVPVTGE